MDIGRKVKLIVFISLLARLGAQAGQDGPILQEETRGFARSAVVSFARSEAEG